MSTQGSSAGYRSHRSPASISDNLATRAKRAARAIQSVQQLLGQAQRQMAPDFNPWTLAQVSPLGLVSQSQNPLQIFGPMVERATTISGSIPSLSQPNLPDAVPTVGQSVGPVQPHYSQEPVFLNGAWRVPAGLAALSPMAEEVMFTLDEAGVPRERSRVGQDRGPTFLPEIGIPIDLDCITKYNEEVQSLKNQLYSRFLHDREAAAKRLAEIAVVCPWAVIPLVSPMAAGYSARDLAQGISRKLIEKYYPCALYSAMIREELTSADGKFDAGRLIAGVRWLVDNGLPDWCRYQFPNADWGAIDDFRLILDEDVELTDDDLLTWARDLFGINPPPPGRD